MRKGIATIIATIILVVITIGLISTAYLYFASIVQVGAVVSIANAFCDASDDIHITIRNEGTTDLSLDAGDFLIGGTPLVADDFTGSDCIDNAIAATKTRTCTIASIGGVATPLADGTLYNLLVIGPRNQGGGPVSC